MFLTPLHAVRFIQYTTTAAASATLASSVHHPSAQPLRTHDYTSLEDMIRSHYPKVMLSQQQQNESTTTTTKTTKTKTLTLHRHFEQQRHSITSEFFRNCEPTNKGVTNFDDEQNKSLNSCLRTALHGFKFDKASTITVVEVGSGTGRLAPFLAGPLLFSPPSPSLSTSSGITMKRNFIFCEPNDHLRAACREVIDRTFRHQCNNNKSVENNVSVELLPVAAHELTPEMICAAAICTGNKQQKEEEHTSLLVMSGVAQYLSDATLTRLFGMFPKVLLQEDICCRSNTRGSSDENNKAVFHERDASFIRSESYFEELFSKSEEQMMMLEIAGTALHTAAGCMTQTWALERRR